MLEYRLQAASVSSDYKMISSDRKNPAASRRYSNTLGIIPTTLRSEFLMLAILAILLTALPEEPLKLGLGQPWYEQEKSAVATIEGILDYQPTTGRIGIPAQYSPFRLVRRVGETTQVEQFTLHAPGHEAQLATLVGYRVNIVGKVQTQGEGEQKRQILCVGTVQSLSIAPSLVFTEVQPIARTSKLNINSGKILDAITSSVMRSDSDVAKAIGTGTGLEAEKVAVEHLKTQFGIKSIDWKLQMVVYIGPTPGNRIRDYKREITKIEVHERGATISWRGDESMQPGRAPSTDTVLLPRIDGEITFKQVTGSKGNKPAATAPATEKLIPQAPVK